MKAQTTVYAYSHALGVVMRDSLVLRDKLVIREIVLLRWSQTSVLLCGLLLIMIGAGVQAPWLRTLTQLAIGAAIAGMIYENRLRQRGESDGVAMLLPLAGGLSGMFALIAVP